jgi:hypothetical protein
LNATNQTYTSNTGPTVVGYGFEGSLKFGFYETFKVLFAKLTPNKFYNYLMASVVAGAVASLVLVRTLPLLFHLNVLTIRKHFRIFYKHLRGSIWNECPLLCNVKCAHVLSTIFTPHIIFP